MYNFINQNHINFIIVMEYQTKIIILNRSVFLGLKCEKFLFSIYHENAQSNNYEKSKYFFCQIV